MATWNQTILKSRGDCGGQLESGNRCAIKYFLELVYTREKTVNSILICPGIQSNRSLMGKFQLDFIYFHYLFSVRIIYFHYLFLPSSHSTVVFSFL